MEKDEQTKPSAKRKKEIIKIGQKINRIEKRKIIGKKSNKTKVGSWKISIKLTNI